MLFQLSIPKLSFFIQLRLIHIPNPGNSIEKRKRNSILISKVLFLFRFTTLSISQRFYILRYTFTSVRDTMRYYRILFTVWMLKTEWIVAFHLYYNGEIYCRVVIPFEVEPPRIDIGLNAPILYFTVKQTDWHKDTCRRSFYQVSLVMLDVDRSSEKIH